MYDHRRRYHISGSGSSAAAAYRSVPSLASHRELQRALESISDESNYGLIGSEPADAPDGFCPSGRYGMFPTATAEGGASYYGCDVSSSDPLMSSPYGRSGVEPLLYSWSSYVSPSTGSSSMRRSTAYVKRR